jgi:phage tail protein X
MATETLTFNGTTPLDLLLWRRYGREVICLAEQTLAGNQGLAALGVFPPLGTKIVVTIPEAAPAPAKKTVSLYD